MSLCPSQEGWLSPRRPSLSFKGLTLKTEGWDSVRSTFCRGIHHYDSFLNSRSNAKLAPGLHVWFRLPHQELVPGTKPAALAPLQVFLLGTQHVSCLGRGGRGWLVNLALC